MVCTGRFIVGTLLAVSQISTLQKHLNRKSNLRSHTHFSQYSEQFQPFQKKQVPTSDFMHTERLANMKCVNFSTEKYRLMFMCHPEQSNHNITCSQVPSRLLRETLCLIMVIGMVQTRCPELKVTEDYHTCAEPFQLP